MAGREGTTRPRWLELAEENSGGEITVRPGERVKKPPSGETTAPPPKRSESQTGGEVVYLPVWPNAVRAVPNGLLRSAVFGALPKGPRRYMRVERVAALEGIEIFYTGEQLDQGDLDVWEGVLLLCRPQALGEECRFTAYALLKTVGKADTGGNRSVLDARLTRLKVSGLRIRLGGRYSYEGSLIDVIKRDEETGHYICRLNPELRQLFEADQFTQLEWAVRQALDGKPLAQWLHGFFATHAVPHPFKISTLRELCGSEVARERDFKPKLRKALEAVAEASAEHAQHFSFSFEGELVCVQRMPSASQKRHLAKKKPPRR